MTAERKITEFDNHSRMKRAYRRITPLRVRRVLWHLRHGSNTDDSRVLDSSASSLPSNTTASETTVSDDAVILTASDSERKAYQTTGGVEMAALSTPLAHTPSYVYKWGESLRLIELLSNISQGGEPAEHPVNRQAFKLRGYSLADSLGVPHPKVFGVYSKAAEVDWGSMPNRFVVKSKWGCVSQRVMLIEQRDSCYVDLRSGAHMTRSEFASWLDTEEGIGDPTLDRVSYSSSESGFWFEQLLDPPPFDWKVYCFDGIPGIVICIDRIRNRFRTFDHDFNGWPGAFSSFPFEETEEMPAPKHPEQLISTACVLSLALHHPHVSIDLYDMPEGVYFGEATAVPGGGEHLCGEADTRLGRLWDQAEARLIAKGFPPFASVLKPR